MHWAFPATKVAVNSTTSFETQCIKNNDNIRPAMEVGDPGTGCMGPAGVAIESPGSS